MPIPDGIKQCSLSSTTSGGENCILHGDVVVEFYQSPLLKWHMNIESIYEYGSRAGFWRLHRMFSERGIPVTIYGVAMQSVTPKQRAMLEADWEIASHGYRWIDSTWGGNRAGAFAAIAIHTSYRQSSPGWYTGRTSPNTRRLVVEEGGFLTTLTATPDLTGYTTTASLTW